MQRPFFDAEGTCQVYLLHPPAGIVGGDELEIAVGVGAGASALLTTPGASKFYRSAGALGLLSQRLAVEAGAMLEWFPQEAIVFDGAIAESRTRVDVQRGGSFAGWEIVVLGRPAAGERFERGTFRQSFDLVVDGSPLLLDRSHYRGGDAALQRRSALSGQPVFGSCVFYPATPEALALVRERLASFCDAAEAAGALAATLVDGVLCVRYLGASGARAREGFVLLWQGLRPLLFGRMAHAPRIWAT